MREKTEKKPINRSIKLAGQKSGVIIAGSTGLGRTGSRPGSEKTSQSDALWRLVFGRQETEGVLGKSRTTGIIRIGVSSKAPEHKLRVSGGGWPFRVFGGFVPRFPRKSSFGQSKSK